MGRPNDEDWREAKRRCRLNEEDIRMAKQLGFKPKSLIKNIPSPSQQWKAPVKEWVRSLYQEKFGASKTAAKQVVVPEPPAVMPAGEERRNLSNPWPDNPLIPVLPPVEIDFEDLDFDSYPEPPSEEDIAEQQVCLLKRQRLFRWAAQAIAVAVSELPEVEKVAAFGAASQPLKNEVPRFREFRRYGIKVPHECVPIWTWPSG